MKNLISFVSVLFCSLFLFLVAFLYYPKWEQKGTEATISWDASGYYFYLPAIFIYQDLKEVKFKDDIIKQYQPTPDVQQAFQHESGNFVMKYSIGQSFVFFPFFSIAHVYAKMSNDYPADGFSFPYQFMISMGSLIVACLGLWFLRKVLLHFFSDLTVGIDLVLIVLATNYLDYAAINGAMTHNTLFTVYTLLLLVSLNFYQRPDYLKAIGIGVLVGFATLTRPTEIISCLIPIFWGIGFPLRESLAKRYEFIKKHWQKYMVSVLFVAGIGSIQLIYWKYVSGSWLVYSYQDQGFSWLKPHLWAGFFSYKSGWLVYTPVMVIALLGFILLYFKKSPVFWVVFIYSLLFVYVTFAWDIWWYGGSLGQRAMIQAYPVLALPMCAFIDFMRQKKVLIPIFAAFSGLMIYYNLWLTHQAHKGGLLQVGEMTKEYFWASVLKNEIDENTRKLLDTDEAFNGIRSDVKIIYQNDFENDSVPENGRIKPIAGQKSYCLSGENQFTPVYFTHISFGNAEWVRASAIFRADLKEWNTWQMTQFIVRFYEGEKIIKERMMRVYRILNDMDTKMLYLDVKAPKEHFNKVGVFFWNAESNKDLLIDNLKIESFNEE